ncbi:CHAT domain-containing protein [Floridanema evergladense]|uniref:CHAT domain-containing protein n=1 Tax=Floridaenema evergladense BLCC-F167 TaxID=3153639 RepID=A0ABV4WIY7_9CYAN
MKRFLRFFIPVIFGLILSFAIHNVFPAKAQMPVANNSTLTLVQTGKNHYDSGQFSQAILNLQEAAQIYERNGDKIKQAQTLSWLALSYQKLGDWQAATNAIEKSLALLNSTSDKNEQVLAQVLNAKGRLLLATGKAENALETWQKSTILYAKVGDEIGVLGSQINQTEAMQALGLHRHAEKLFAEIEKTLKAQPDSFLKATGLRNLGKVLRLGGSLDESERILGLSLAIAQNLPNSTQAQSETLLSLANTERTLAKRAENLKNIETARKYVQAALEKYEKVGAIATLPLTQIQAKLNQLSLLIETNQTSNLQPLLSQILSQINSLPPSRESIYAAVNLAENWLKLKNESATLVNSPSIETILETAAQKSEKLADKKAQSYVLGTWGKLSEKQQNWAKAKNFTQTALLLAQQISAPDIAYQWQWQLGRLFQSSFNQNAPSKEAISYYTEAFNTLNNLRSDLVSLNPEIQFSFRENIEPVYRELANLLLLSPNPSIDNLIKSRNVMEALQLAEINNFFRDACATAEPVNIDELDRQAAIIYPIILKERLEIIVKLPGRDNLRHYSTNISEVQIDNAVEQLLTSLTKRSTSLSKIKKDSQQIYDWLVKPLVTDLENTANQKSIKTLVFVLDGSLRNIPPAVLYDGKQYLIEKYAVAVTPGLQLINPRPLSRTNLKAIIAGASNAPSFQAEGLSPIDNVSIELATIREQISQSEKLENQNFQQEKIESVINSAPFNLVHIATHGKFSSNPEDTFLLDWNKRIKVKDFDNLLRIKKSNEPNSLDLLILSACETAAGDKRAALGLAGIAIRAGASSTLATLWQINDASTAEFMALFYQQLNNPQISKAEALRNTQIAFLTKYSDTDYDRPYHWAAFTLVGNWL